MKEINKYTVNCHSCKPPETDKNRMVLWGGYGTDSQVIDVLRTDQQGARGWLGRSVCYTLEHLSFEEVLSYSESRNRCKIIHFMACQRLLGATRPNFAEAGNKNIDENKEPTSEIKYHHPHEHVISRCKNEITWRDKKFVDHTFYDPMELDPTPSEKEKKLNQERFEKTGEKINVPLTLDEVKLLKDDLQKELVKMIFDEKLSNKFRPKWEEVENAYPSEEVKEMYKKLYDSLQENLN